MHHEKFAVGCKRSESSPEGAGANLDTPAMYGHLHKTALFAGNYIILARSHRNLVSSS